MVYILHAKSMTFYTLISAEIHKLIWYTQPDETYIPFDILSQLKLNQWFALSGQS